MALFTAIATAIFAGTALAGTFAVTATAFALQAAAGIGLSLAAQAIAGKKAAGDGAAAQAKASGFSAQGRLSAAGDLPRSFLLGYGSTAGSLVYANTWGTDGDTPNAYLTQVIALSDIPAQSLEEVWINGELCTLADTAHPTMGFPVLEYRKGGNDYLWVKFYDGTQTAADSFLVNSVASTARPYESTRVGTGIAYVICTSRVEDTLFTGFPQFKFALIGRKLYDPSQDDTAGGTGDQRWSDPSTWGGDGDHLPAVQAYNLLRGITFDDDWFYGLQNLPAARLPLENWIVQIEKCRAEIEGADGLEPTYRAGGEIKVDNEIADTVEALLTACHGRLSEIGGFYKLHCGEPGSPSFVFTDADILSTDEQSFTPFHGLSDTINGIAGRYPSPAEGWNVRSAPSLYRPDLEAEDGDRRLMADVAFDLVPYDEQVQRLMSSALEEARRARRHTFGLPPAFWLIEPGDIGEWTSERNGYVSKLFRVDGVVDRANLDILADLTEIDPSDYDWDTDADYEAPAHGAVTFPRPSPQAIVDWAAVGTALVDADGLQRRPAILLSWDGDMDDIEGIEFEVRLAATQAVVHRGRTENYAAGEIVITQGLLPESVYGARGRYIARGGRETLWSDWLSATTPNVRLSAIEFENGLRDYVTRQLQEYSGRIDDIAQMIAAYAATQDAQNFLDKTELKRTISAREESLKASISETLQVAVSTEAAFASYQLNVNAQLAAFDAQVDINATAIATIDGKLVAGYTVQLDVNGYASGFKAYNDGSLASFTISADVFQVAWPGMSGGAAVPVFQIANVDGVAKLTLRGDMFADGTITAQHLAANSITADSIDATAVEAVVANIHDLTAENIRSDYAIFNKVLKRVTPLPVSASSIYGPGAPASPYVAHTVLSKTYTSVSGVIQWNAGVNTGAFSTINFPGGTINIANVSVVARITISRVSDGAVLQTQDFWTTGYVTPASVSGQARSGSNFLNIAPGSEITVSLVFYISVTGGGTPIPGSNSASGNVTSAYVVFLEPNGLETI